MRASLWRRAAASSRTNAPVPRCSRSCGRSACPILAGLKDRFNLTACVIDPYYGQNAVTAGVEEVFGKGFSQVMTLLLIAFIVNILLVRFNKVTKCRTLFTTGHVQVQQAATAYWLIMFALPALLNNDVLSP